MRRFLPVGTWLSLVEHSLGVRGVGSSNLPVPTNLFKRLSIARLHVPQCCPVRLASGGEGYPSLGLTRAGCRLKETRHVRIPLRYPVGDCRSSDRRIAVPVCDRWP